MKLIIRGDEAWTESEWEARLRRDERRRQWRESKRRMRALALPPQVSKPIRVGALHELSCKGPHRPNQRCTPIPMFQRRFWP